VLLKSVSCVTVVLRKCGKAQALLACGSEHTARSACIVPAQVPSKLNLVFLDAPDSASLPTCSSRGSNSSSWVSVFNNSPQCWPTALLPTQLPAVSISILPFHLSLAELRSSKQRGRAVAARLVQAVQHSLQQDCHQQLVLIGHGFGGHLLKVRAHQATLNPKV
jgi:hypothetical protein